MQERTQPQYINEVIHKKKVAKKKTKDQSPIELVDNRTIGQNTPKSDNVNRQLGNSDRQLSIDHSDLARAERRSRRIRNQEIDQYMLGLVMEGLLNESYIPWLAKRIYVLGLPLVNDLAIQSRAGKYPDRLFISKVDGRYQLHFKRLMFEQQTEVEP